MFVWIFEILVIIFLYHYFYQQITTTKRKNSDLLFYFLFCFISSLICKTAKKKLTKELSLQCSILDAKGTLVKCQTKTQERAKCQKERRKNSIIDGDSFIYQ